MEMAAIVGGLIGWGSGARIVHSFVSSARISGRHGGIGGLVGWGVNSRIASSIANAGFISGNDQVGGLVGIGKDAELSSSLAITGPISAKSLRGGLVGLVENTISLSSYWDGSTSGIIDGTSGAAKTSLALTLPTNYSSIYSSWKEDRLGCDWDFGKPTEYPALGCIPLTAAEQRALYRVDYEIIPALPLVQLALYSNERGNCYSQFVKLWRCNSHSNYRNPIKMEAFGRACP